MKVRDIMTKEVVCINKDTSAKDLIKKFIEHKLHSAPVVDGSNVLVGMISIRDIFKVLTVKYLNEGNSMVKEVGVSSHAQMEDVVMAEDIMTGSVKCIKEEDSILKAIMNMYADNIVRLPVVDDRNVVRGLLSQSDVLRSMLSLSKKK